MKKYPHIILLLLIVFTGCKSNQEAYSTAYKRLKEKEEELMDAKAKTAMDVPKDTMSKDSTAAYQSERFTLILGDEPAISIYNIVSRSFINRTNAKGFFNQMKESGYPAALVQNEQMMFRIIIGAFEKKEEAEHELAQIRQSYPEAYILLRIKD
jgi:Sporulation related domain.